MTEARGKKPKKVKWNLSLGLKDVVFAGLGVAGLMMMSFALGTLAGRGDIYRVLHNWGLLGPEATRAVQPWSPPAGPPPMSAPAQSPVQAQLAPAAGGSAKVAPSEPVKGSVAAPPAPAATAKKAPKPGALAQKHKEEELRRLREEVAHKLKFQNSLDTGGTKPSRTTAKPKTKEPDKTAATKSGPTLVKVGQFRDKKAAQAKVAALQKQGEKASLKEGKDQQGTYYTVYRQGSEAAKAAGQTAAKNQEKSAGTANKSSQAPERH